MADPEPIEQSTPPPLLSPTFVWVEVNRRIDAITHRVDALDSHGSRGVDSLRLELGRLREDLEGHERSHERQTAEQRSSRRFTLGTIVALVTPLYPLLIWILSR